MTPAGDHAAQTLCKCGNRSTEGVRSALVCVCVSAGQSATQCMLGGEVLDEWMWMRQMVGGFVGVQS